MNDQYRSNERFGRYATDAEAGGQRLAPEGVKGWNGIGYNISSGILQPIINPVVKVDLHPRLAFWWLGGVKGFEKNQ